jgi:hypothetical protein
MLLVLGPYLLWFLEAQGLWIERTYNVDFLERNEEAHPKSGGLLELQSSLQIQFPFFSAGGPGLAGGTGGGGVPGAA